MGSVVSNTPKKNKRDRFLLHLVFNDSRNNIENLATLKGIISCEHSILMEGSVKSFFCEQGT